LRDNSKDFIDLSNRAKMITGGHVHVSFYAKIWPKLAHPLQNADFQSIFARSASAVTLSEISSIITNMKSSTRFPMKLSWTACVASKPPKKAQNAKCPKI